MEAGGSKVIRVPIRPERTGIMNIQINAASSYGAHSVTKSVTVGVSFAAQTNYELFSLEHS